MKEKKSKKRKKDEEVLIEEKSVEDDKSEKDRVGKEKKEKKEKRKDKIVVEKELIKIGDIVKSNDGDEGYCEKKLKLKDGKGEVFLMKIEDEIFENMDEYYEKKLKCDWKKNKFKEVVEILVDFKVVYQNEDEKEFVDFVKEEGGIVQLGELDVGFGKEMVKCD